MNENLINKINKNSRKFTGRVGEEILLNLRKFYQFQMKKLIEEIKFIFCFI